MTSRYFPAKTPLFEQKDGKTYRIPALIHLPVSRTLLAFAEERSSTYDADAKVLVMRRGKIGSNGVDWEDMKEVTQAQLPGHRSMNPCPVNDHETQKLFLFFIAILGKTSEGDQLSSGINVTRLCCVSSTDEGHTWSAASDLTDSTLGCSVKFWATFALGPGHGIQLQSHRLLIPASAYFIASGCCRFCCRPSSKPKSHSFTLYSDDAGSSWQCGGVLSSSGTGECQLVSLDEGGADPVLYCNARTSGTSRAQALSYDQGTSFQEEQRIPKLVELQDGCHGSVVGFPGFPQRRTGESWANAPSAPTCVLYCHPTSPTSRLDLGVYLNTTPRDPDRWSEPWVIHQGPSAYSDLAYIQTSSPENREACPLSASFTCLYESGSTALYQNITFTQFTMQELLDNIPRLPGDPGSLPSTAAAV